MTAYKAVFSIGTHTRTSAHAYKTAAVAVRDGKPFLKPVFSSGEARARMPGDAERRSARCPCYNRKQAAAFRARGAALDAGWVEERVSVLQEGNTND